MDTIFKNTAWQLIERTFRMAGGVLMSVLTADYLGPEGFGILNYAFAFSTFFHVVTSLGFEASLVKNILENGAMVRKIIGTAIFLRVLVAILMFLLALGIIRFFEPDRPQLWLMSCLLGLAFIFQAGETIEYQFQAEEVMEKSSWARSLAFLASVAFRFWLIMSGKPVVWFASALLVEAAFSSALFFFFNHKTGKGLPRILPADSKLAKNIFLAGLPMVFSSMVWFLYARLDQVMVARFLGDASSGFFSVSTKLVEIFIFLPTALSASLLPGLIKAKSESESLFTLQMQRLLDLVFLLGTLVCIFLLAFAPYLIRYSFGSAYLPASEALAIQGFVCLFSFFGGAGQQFFIVHNKTRVLLMRNLLGAGINIGLNILWIPAYGINGACYATLVSTFIVHVAFNWFSQISRPLFYQQLRSVWNLLNGETFAFIFSRIRPFLSKTYGNQ